MTLVLATPTQLRDRLQDPNLSVATCAQAIADASALVRAIARQTFDFVAGDTIELLGGGRDVILPERPVVVDAGHPLTVAELDTLGNVLAYPVEGAGFHRIEDTLQKRWNSQWQPAVGAVHHLPYIPALYLAGVWSPTVRVTYSHGYTVTPDWLTAVVLDAATEYAVNPQKFRTETVGGVSLTWAGESMRAPSMLVDQLRVQLPAVGARRGGAFSIRTV